MERIYSRKISLHNVRKERNCPKCGNPMKLVTEEKSMAGGGTASLSNVKSYQSKFYCSFCRLKYTGQDLIRIEKQSKNK